MPIPIRRRVLRFIRIPVRIVKTVAPLVIALGLGLGMGRRWGGTVDNPHGQWYGLVIGFLMWLFVLRPRQKARQELVRAGRRLRRRERRRERRRRRLEEEASGQNDSDTASDQKGDGSDGEESDGDDERSPADGSSA